MLNRQDKDHCGVCACALDCVCEEGDSHVRSPSISYSKRTGGHTLGIKHESKREGERG